MNRAVIASAAPSVRFQPKTVDAASRRAGAPPSISATLSAKL